MKPLQITATITSDLVRTKDAKITLYANRGEKTGVEITIEDFADGIRNGPDWKAQTEHVRSGPDKATNKDEYDQRKAKAACVTISGTYQGDKSEKSLRDYSGFIALDFDGLEDVEVIRTRLKADPFVYAVFKSIGGKGLCVLVKIQPERFADAFLALEDYFMTTYCLIVDKQCKNVNRLRYISYDPAIFVNEGASLWRKYLPAKERKMRDKPVGDYIDTDRDFKHVLEQIQAHQLDITTGYNEWYRVGFALVAKFGETGREYFHVVSQYHPDYDPAKCDKTFDYLLRYGSREITISTFYYFAKTAGVDVMSPQTKEIVTVATSSKRNKVTPDSTVDTVVKMLNVPADECRPIIQQVYSATVEIEVDETIYQQAATLLRLKGLRFNEIRRRFVNSEDIELDERGLNNLYIECLNRFDGKLKRPDFDTLIKSDAVPMFNPLRSFFLSYRHRKPNGVIQALAATLETDTGFDDAGNFDPHYVVYFIRKWLIGMVANIFYDKDVCALMPVLTGKQGSGKTEWFRRLLPDELQVYYAECKFEEGKDDEILMTQKLILMNDELEGLTVQDARKLKALTSKRVFTLREPYGRASADFVRLAVLCGTSNPREVISDPTGNRRVIPINVISINHAAYNAIDKIDVLMEAFHAWKAGERHTLTGEDILVWSC